LVKKALGSNTLVAFVAWRDRFGGEPDAGIRTSTES